MRDWPPHLIKTLDDNEAQRLKRARQGKPLDAVDTEELLWTIARLRGDLANVRAFSPRLAGLAIDRDPATTTTLQVCLALVEDLPEMLDDSALVGADAVDVLCSVWPGLLAAIDRETRPT